MKAKFLKLKQWLITVFIPLTTKAMVKYLLHKGYSITAPKNKK